MPSFYEKALPENPPPGLSCPRNSRKNETIPKRTTNHRKVISRIGEGFMLTPF